MTSVAIGGPVLKENETETVLRNRWDAGVSPGTSMASSELIQAGYP